MTLVKWNTARDLEKANHPFSYLFNDVLANFSGENGGQHVPSVNVHEGKDGYDLELAAPGYQKEDFQIDVVRNVLTIAVEKSEEVTSEDKKYTRKEFTTSSFKRSFNLPDLVNQNSISATYQNGILHLHIPLKDETVLKGKQIPVK